MSWDTDFYAAVMANSDFATGVSSLAYEYKADALAPFATYQLVAAGGTNDLGGAGDEGERLIQKTVWASSPTEAKELAEHGIAGAKAGLDVISVDQRSLGRDPDEELFGYAADLLIWFQNP